MKFCRRLAVVLAGYIAAAIAGLIVPAGFIFIGFPDKITLSAVTAGIWGLASLILAVAAPLLVPALFVIAVCEVFRVRTKFAYLSFGVVVAVALAIYTIGPNSAGELFTMLIAMVTGVLAGFVYWLIAGRTAGEWLTAR